MSWSPITVEEQREEFVGLARKADANVSELCRRFGISRKTGYKWLSRDDVANQSRRPINSPARTAADVEARVVEVRQAHPAWGGRKIARVLERDAAIELAPSTVTWVLHRHGLISPDASDASKAWTRFEHPHPNALWQMDFKGHIPVGSKRCHPLTVIDDHSRFNLVLDALDNEQGACVQASLKRAFERYGMPERINTDNGPPWGSAGRGVTHLNVWMIRLGIRTSHSSPYHPQTNGKDERFHRTFKAEVLSRNHFEKFSAAQASFDEWRTIYNCKRPHEAIDMQTPMDRYAPSPRPMPRGFAPVEYSPDDIVRKVSTNGIVKLKGLRLRTSIALDGQHVALRPVHDCDGVYDVFLCHQRVDRLDLRVVQSQPA